MHKLIQAYANNPQNREAAKRLLAYLNKHPMAICMASANDQIIIAAARAIAN